MTTTTSNPKPTTRWLRFSLRSLLLLIVVIAVPLAWTMNRARQQRIAVTALQEMGCAVEYDGGSPFVPECVRNVLGEDVFRNVTGVNGAFQITDAGLVYLRMLTRLTHLNLTAAHVTDAGLDNLQGLTQLTDLNLTGTQVTNAGLVNLRELTQPYIPESRQNAGDGHWASASSRMFSTYTPFSGPNPCNRRWVGTSRNDGSSSNVESRQDEGNG